MDVSAAEQAEKTLQPTHTGTQPQNCPKMAEAATVTAVAAAAAEGAAGVAAAAAATLSFLQVQGKGHAMVPRAQGTVEAAWFSSFT